MTAHHTFDNGVKVLRAHLLDVQVERYSTANIHEPVEEHWFLEMLRRTTGSDPVILDVGAGVGYYSILAKLTNPRCRVFAFEPLKAHAKAITENLALNGLADSITIVEEAVAGDVGRLPFLEAHYGSRLMPEASGDANYPSVASTSLEAFVRDVSGKADIVKVDVQGHELSVIDGARGVVDKIGGWVIGTHGSEIHAACIAALDELGYAIVFEDPTPDGQPDGLIVAARRG